MGEVRGIEQLTVWPFQDNSRIAFDKLLCLILYLFGCKPVSNNPTFYCIIAHHFLKNTRNPFVFGIFWWLAFVVQFLLKSKHTFWNSPEDKIRVLPLERPTVMWWSKFVRGVERTGNRQCRKIQNSLRMLRSLMAFVDTMSFDCASNTAEHSSNRLFSPMVVIRTLFSINGSSTIPKVEKLSQIDSPPISWDLHRTADD